MKSTRTYLPHIVSCFTWHLTRIADEWSNKWSLLHFPRKYSEFLGANRPEISTKTSHVLVEPFFRLLVWAVWPRLKTELVSLMPQADGGPGQSDRGSTQENEAVRDRNPCRHAQSNRVNVPGLDCRLFERKRVLFRANIGSQAHN